MYDVIVVGAGPGGATSAFYLARAGLRTLLLEKEKMPRYKPCGGGLTAKVQGVLEMDFSPTVEDTISVASVAYGSERVQVKYDQPLAWMVMRDKFDLLLTERAAQTGAEVREGEQVTGLKFEDDGVTVSTRAETIRSKLVIGADGVNGIVRRSAGFPRHQAMAVALEAEMEASSAALEVWRQTLHVDFAGVKWGYAWIFPKAEHLSVGVGAFMRANRHIDLKSDLARYLATEPTLRQAKEIFSRGHRIPVGGRPARYHSPRALLVGDAAGVVDPFSGEGIYYAILSGRMAAEEIIRAFEHSDGPTKSNGGFDLSAYTKRVNSAINSDFRFAMWLAEGFYRVPHFAFRTYRRSKRTQEAARQILSGGVTYPTMLRGLAKGLFRSVLPHR